MVQYPTDTPTGVLEGAARVAQPVQTPNSGYFPHLPRSAMWTSSRRLPQKPSHRICPAPWNCRRHDYLPPQQQIHDNRPHRGHFTTPFSNQSYSNISRTLTPSMSIHTSQTLPRCLERSLTECVSGKFRLLTVCRLYPFKIRIQDFKFPSKSQPHTRLTPFNLMT